MCMTQGMCRVYDTGCVFHVYLYRVCVMDMIQGMCHGYDTECVSWV